LKFQAIAETTAKNLTLLPHPVEVSLSI